MPSRIERLVDFPRPVVLRETSSRTFKSSELTSKVIFKSLRRKPVRVEFALTETTTLHFHNGKRIHGKTFPAYKGTKPLKMSWGLMRKEDPASFVSMLEVRAFHTDHPEEPSVKSKTLRIREVPK